MTDTNSQRVNLCEQICLVEGMSRSRINYIREKLPRLGGPDKPIVHVPYIWQLANDKQIKGHIFARGDHRDAMSECLGSLANRRSCFVSAVNSLDTAPPSTEVLVCNVHLLSSYSALREHLGVARWAELVSLIFSDLMPRYIVFFDHEYENGNLCDSHRSWSYRSEVDVRRDNARRRMALEALAQHLPDLNVLRIPAGVNPNTEVKLIKDFLGISTVTAQSPALSE